MDFIIDNFDKLFDSEQHLKKLKEIILDLAVKGKLVPQNPDDEPASVLLEKIKAEKEKLIKEKKIKKDISHGGHREHGEEPFEIPDSWEWVRLGEIGETQTGTTPPTGNLEYFNGNIPFIKPADISEFGINYYNESLTEKGLEKGRLIKKNSVLMVCIGGSTGKSFYIDRDCSCNQQINAITGYCNIEAKFINYFMNSSYFYNNLISKATGTATPIINKSKWEELYFPLPPLAEQKRIVEKVDSLKKLIDTLKEKAKVRDKTREELKKSIMAEIEKSDSNIDLLNSLEMVFKNFDTIVKNKEDIKDIRDLILSMAVKGKLVPQNPDDEPASVLLEKIKAEKEKLIKEKKIKKDKELELINEDEKPFEIPDSWEWVRLGEIANNIHYGYTASADFTNNDVRLLRITDIQNNKVNWENVPGCDITEKDYKSYALEENDILIARTGGTIGKSYIVKNIIVKSVFASYLIRVIPSKISYADFTKILIETPLYWEQLYAKSMGTGQPNVNGVSLSNLILPFPPLAEQKRIVEKVDKLMALCDNLEKKVEKSQKEFEKILESAIKEVTANNAN